MNIVFLLNHFMPYHIAGTEVYTWALAKSLQQKGHQITIILPNYGSDEFDEYNYDELSVKRYPEPDNKDRLLIMGKRAPDGIKAFEELIRKISPDIVHIQELAGSSGMGIYHVRLLSKMDIKTMFTMHLAVYSCFCGTLMYKGKEACSGVININRCTQCALSKLPVSNTIADFLYETSMPLYKLGVNTGKLNRSIGTAFSYPFIIRNLQKTLFEITNLCSNIIVITDWYKDVLLKNGIPIQKIKMVKQALPYPVQPAQNSLKKASKSLRLIFIGRIDPIKGLHLLLDAIDTFAEHTICLNIYGGVNDEDYYQMWKNKTTHKTNIFWKGVLPPKEVVPAIRQHDLLVLPSTVCEMSPLVIEEAFAAQVPVLASDVFGNAEQITDGVNSWLFTFNSAESLKDKLHSLIENPEQIEAVKKNIRAVRSFGEVADEYEIIYKSSLQPVL